MLSLGDYMASLGELPHVLNVTSIVCLALLLSATCYFFYIRFVSSLSGVPGPLSAALSRFWLAHHSRKGDMHLVMRKLHRKYGKVVRTAPGEVSISDLNAIKAIYGPGSKYKKSDWYSVWQGTQKDDLFAERSIAVHGALRRNISRMYAMSYMSTLEKWVDDAISCFMERMHEQESRSIDLGMWLQLLAFDVIGELSFSKRFGFLEAGKDDGTLDLIEKALRSLAWVGQVPWVFWLDYYLAPYIGHHLDLVLRHGRIRNYASKEVEARRGRVSEHNDILGQLFEVQKEKPDQLSDSAVTSIATANVFAGSDTTAISLRAVIYYLLKNPRSLGKLHEEIEDRKKGGRLTFPVKFSQASEMPYLKPASRRHYDFIRLVDGHLIPAGTVVGANAWVVHRDPTVWGDDVEAYRPERWLERNRGEMERSFLAFGGGARSCIGKNISIMEISKLIPAMLNEFRLELTNPDQPLEERCWWFVKQEGLFVKLHPRSKS